METKQDHVRVVSFAYYLVRVVSFIYSLVRVVNFAYSLVGVINFAYSLVRVVRDSYIPFSFFPSTYCLQLSVFSLVSSA